jgi:hypothetical protein
MGHRGVLLDAGCACQGADTLKGTGERRVSLYLPHAGHFAIARVPIPSIDGIDLDCEVVTTLMP